MKTHLEGVPGLGTYAELQAMHAKLAGEITAATPSVKEMPADPAAASALVAGIDTYSTKLAEAAAFHAKLAPETVCDSHAGDWEGLAKQATASKRELGVLVRELIDKDARELNRWASNQPRFI